MLEEVGIFLKESLVTEKSAYHILVYNIFLHSAFIVARYFLMHNLTQGGLSLCFLPRSLQHIPLEFSLDKHDQSLAPKNLCMPSARCADGKETN